MKKIVIIFSLVVLIVLATGCGSKNAVKELITKLPDAKYTPASLVFSPDGRRAAYIDYEGLEGVKIVGGNNAGEGFSFRSARVILDGQEGPRYKAGVRDLIFSPNSQGFAYIVKTDEQECVVFNGREQKRYEKILGESLTFSPNGNRIVYVARSGGKYIAVLGGVQEYSFELIPFVTPFLFSPDGQHVAFVAEEKGLQFAVIDGKTGEKSEKVFLLNFSPDGTRLFTQARRNGQTYFLDNDREVPEPLAMSPDGKRNAYAMSKNDKSYLVVDNWQSSEYDKIFPKFVVFSPNGEKCAFLARKDDSLVVVVDGVESQSYPDFRFPASRDDVIFMPFSGKLVYKAWAGGEVVVVNGRVGTTYDKIENLTISPDQDRIAFIAESGSEEFVVVNGKEDPFRVNNTQGDYIKDLIFSPIEGHYAYIIKTAFLDDVILDGKKAYQESNIQSLFFSSDGRQVIFIGGVDLSFVSINGKKGEPFDDIINDRIFVETSGLIRYTARDGRNIYRVEEKLSLRH